MEQWWGRQHPAPGSCAEDDWRDSWRLWWCCEIEMWAVPCSNRCVVNGVSPEPGNYLNRHQVADAAPGPLVPSSQTLPPLPPISHSHNYYLLPPVPSSSPHLTSNWATAVHLSFQIICINSGKGKWDGSMWTMSVKSTFTWWDKKVKDTWWNINSVLMILTHKIRELVSCPGLQI